jgi:hypothetical protein
MSDTIIAIIPYDLDVANRSELIANHARIREHIRRATVTFASLLGFADRWPDFRPATHPCASLSLLYSAQGMKRSMVS